MPTLQEIRDVLSALPYPATPDEIVRYAQAQRLPQEVVDRLRTELAEPFYSSTDSVMDVLRGDA